MLNQTLAKDGIFVNLSDAREFLVLLLPIMSPMRLHASTVSAPSLRLCSGPKEGPSTSQEDRIIDQFYP